ncbi:unnamed protein product [Thelazia callipaeda]|uniref:Uncharacterized protein n=1 Tax=Thelazia callipaeda TaxID=103827 RepID=A0A0N5CJT0_THECL|nr:unnamed protein product [Thelazia callipaeda]
MARIICDNSDNFQSISQDAFLIPQEKLTPCSAIPKLDLMQWQE